jgi:ABC-type multidrug transport system permease subunit
MSLLPAYHAVGSIARKELLHILRDRRILVLVLTLPPMFTLVFGYAFEHAELHDMPALVVNADRGALSEAFVELLKEKPCFKLRVVTGETGGEIDLLKEGVAARIEIPDEWTARVAAGDPIPLGVTLDGTDTNTAAYLEGYLREALAEFQLKQRDAMIETLPDEVFEMGERLPVEVRKQFVSAMEPWEMETRILYNPEMKVIDYVTPGIIGLILQLLTVTLMACTITRERESGTLAQLRVTSLTRGEIVIGKVLPYLLLSVVLILVIVSVAAFHFHVEFRNPFVLAVVCLLFLLCSLGLGLVISAVSESQTQAIQIAVLFLLPVFPLSGAFAPLQQLPTYIQVVAQIFPLTHFCHAFRLVNLGDAGWSMIAGDLAFLVGGALVTCVGAALLLNASDD